MRMKLLFSLIAGLMMVGLLVGCTQFNNGDSQPAATPTAGASENGGETEQPAPTPAQPEGEVEVEASPPAINLPVVGVSASTPTPESADVGAGQNPPETGPSDPESGGGVLVEAGVFIDSVEVEVQEGDLPQVNLVVQGSLPTPCHQFAHQPEQPDSEGRINVRIFSLLDAQAECTQMLQPFEQTINLGMFPPGSYTILINGEELQKLDF